MYYNGCFFTKNTSQALSGKISGAGIGVQQHVKLIEAKFSSQAASSSTAASTGAPADVKFPGKVKPPPPIKWPGYADAIRSPPAPKAEAPKSVPDVVAKPAEKSAVEQPAQKKAALTSKPKPVPAASSAAMFLEPVPKGFTCKSRAEGTSWFTSWCNHLQDSSRIQSFGDEDLENGNRVKIFGVEASP